MKNLTILFALIFLLNGCSSDDNSDQTDDQQNEETTVIDGGIAYTFEMVTIPIVGLTQDQYSGLINDVQINGIKNSTNEIVFQVPSNIATGNQVLTFQGIDAKINLQIIATELTQSPEEELSDYFDNISSFQNELTNTSEHLMANEYLNSFDNYYNSLSNEDKTRIALNYKANKEFIDYILTTDFSRSLIDGTDLEILGKMALASTIWVSAGWIAVASLPNLVSASFFGTLAYVGWVKFKNYNIELTDRNVKVVTLLMDDIEALITGRGQNTHLEITSGVLSSFPLKSNKRPLIAGDTSSENTNISKFGS